jgi:hypothetical protein
MRKSLSRLCALGLTAAMTLGSFVPTQAAPVVPMRSTTSLPAAAAGAPAAEVVPVQYRQGNRQIRRGDRRHMRRHDRRQIRRDARRDYYNGHRGYRNQRRGYRRHNGYWFPPAAFIAGAIIGGATSNRGVSSAHIRSCQSRYRSYRASDNTFQPYNGPRQQCR